MEPPGRSDQRVSFIQHLSSTFDTKLYSSRIWVRRYFSPYCYHILASQYIFKTIWRRLNLQSSKQGVLVNGNMSKSQYCGLLRSNEDIAACFAIVCLFVYISLAFAGHSASKDASTATLAGAYLPHSASERS